ncbi:MAG: thymidine kinase [Paraglaciecola sp.]|jgi:thymidine kinase
MKIKKSELQDSYQAMIDNVEEFVVKEGKTLHQAFHAAEKKLDDAKEISKDKIHQASKELKHNLRLFGDTVEGVSEAYKQQIKFDLAYINDSIWNKFQGIANSNTAEFLTFTKALKQQAQTVITEEHLAAHQEHTQWHSEHALWLDEVGFWKKDNQQALTKLIEIEKALKQQSTSLFEHEQVIQAFANMDGKHEEIMTDAEKDPSSEVFKEADESEIAAHNNERIIHGQHSEFHHTVKTHHYKIMAMINMLYKELHTAQ